MPTANFLAAASADNRKPVILMAVESVDAIKKECSIQQDWQANKSALNLNLTAPNPYDKDELGVVFLAANGDEDYSGQYTAEAVVVNLSTPIWVEGGVESAAAISVNNRTVGTVINARVKTTDIVDMGEGGRWSYLVDTHIKILGSHNGDAFADLYEGVVTNAGSSIISGSTGYQYKDVAIPITGLAIGEWQFKIVVVSRDIVRLYGPNPPFSHSCSATLVSHVDSYETHYLATGTIQTKTLDLGLIPTQDSRLQLEDIVPSGCSLTYTARGSNDNSTWVDLGAVGDNSGLGKYRYYDITASFASSADGLRTPVLQAVRVVGGNSQFDYYSTHKDTPVSGAKPYIKEGGISSLTSKIDLLKPATTGEVTAKLFWRKKTGDMLATGYLKNKAVSVKLGFQGLAEGDYEPYFTGTWHDYSADGRSATIDVKTRDIWKKFKTKVPDEGYFLDPSSTIEVSIDGKKYKIASGKKVEGQVYTLSGNIIQVMLDIIDMIGAPDRYIDRAAFTALRDGSRSGADWNVYRLLTEPTSAEDMLNELAVSAGAFIYPLPSGKMTITLFDDVVAVTPDKDHTLDANRVSFKVIDGGQKELTTRVAIYYGKINGKDGSSKEDYGQIHAPINIQAATDWDEHKGMEWLDKWDLGHEALGVGKNSLVAIQKLAKRLDSWLANPKFTVKAENVPPRYMGINPGSVIAVDNLELPTTAENWDAGLRYTNAKKFLVMSKTFNPKDFTLSFDLLEVGPTVFQLQDLPAYPAYALFPPVTDLNLTERIAAKPGGGVDIFIDVSFEQPTDFHFGSSEVWFRQVGGVWSLATAIPNGAPVETRTASILVSAGVSYEVAVLTINAAGLRMPLPLAVYGAIAIYPPQAPGAVNDLSAQVIDNTVILRWSVPAAGTFPVAGYIVSQGLDFATAVQLQHVDGTAAVINESFSGNYKYWVQAVDTSELAGDPAGIYATVNQPRDYELVDTQALDWSGTIVNAVIENGALIVPVNADETYQEHFDNNSWETPQDQVDAGHPLFVQPGQASGSYEQVIDYGAPVPRAIVTLDVSRETIEGTITVTPTISLSTDNVAWADHVGVYQIYATGTRYVKFKLDFASADNGICRVTSAVAKLDVTKRTEEYKISCLSTDASGTPVDITGLFADVLSITVTPWGTTPITPVVDFVDDPYPTEFKVYLFDNAGARVSGTATITVRGVQV